MKIETLFDELKELTKDKESVFANSGMINRFKEMQFGFFPLGWGILTENNKIPETVPTTEIEEGGVMVLGNDFGTVKYLNDYVNSDTKKIGETDSKTIKHLLFETVDLDTQKTFFTNFYLGVRTNEAATMIKRVEELNEDYRKVCYQFFIRQLELIKPKTVVCLGHDVKNALIESIESEEPFVNSKKEFYKWKPRFGSIKKLYISSDQIIESTQFGAIRFIVIPHPCDLRNFTKEYQAKLKSMLNPNMIEAL